MLGLCDLLQRNVALSEFGRDGFFDFPNDYGSPGYWTAYTARARLRNLRLAELGIPAGEALDYARAIRIQRALGEPDTYPHERKRAGLNYSPLVLLESREQTDQAFGEISNCIRGLFSEPEYAEFVSTICDLIGDLLDNVWSHGKSTGFSMAQKWRDQQPGEFFFEFAVADCGLGFLREVKRTGIQGIETDRAAIEWCIQRGHSTKMKPVSDWAQRLPQDIMNNPMPNVGHVVESDNHHLGLGLAKLVEGVERFNGTLWLASGASMLGIHPEKGHVYEELRIPWQGVAIACRFESARVAEHLAARPRDEFEDILKSLIRS